MCHEQALQDFEEVISTEPKNYLGDDFSRITQIYRVAQYNLACCYSAIDQVSLAYASCDSTFLCDMFPNNSEFISIRSSTHMPLL